MENLAKDGRLKKPVASRPPTKPRTMSVRERCLTKKEIMQENYLMAEIKAAEKEMEQRGGGHSEDLLFQTIQLVTERMQLYSPTLAIKLMPLLKVMATQRHHASLRECLSVVPMARLPEDENVEEYAKSFFGLFDDDRYVSFAMSPKHRPGGLTMRDIFYLTLYTFANCVRSSGDHLLQLMICGESSVGKSTLIEDIMLERGHNVTTDQGVGRFCTGERNSIVLHDINLVLLCRGPDADKYKTIARGETTSVKVHSTTASVKPLFLLATSNKILFDHHLPLPGPYGNTRVVKSPLSEASFRPRLTPDELKPVRYRFLECYIRGRPAKTDEEDQKKTTFRMRHFVVALYDRVLEILERHTRQDFPNENLARYCLAALWNEKVVRPRAEHKAKNWEEVSRRIDSYRKRIDEAREKLGIPDIIYGENLKQASQEPPPVLVPAPPMLPEETKKQPLLASILAPQNRKRMALKDLALSSGTEEELKTEKDLGWGEISITRIDRAAKDLRAKAKDESLIPFFRKPDPPIEGKPKQKMPLPSKIPRPSRTVRPSQASLDKEGLCVPSRTVFSEHPASEDLPLIGKESAPMTAPLPAPEVAEEEREAENVDELSRANSPLMTSSKPGELDREEEEGEIAGSESESKQANDSDSSSSDSESSTSDSSDSASEPDLDSPFPPNQLAYQDPFDKLPSLDLLGAEEEDGPW